MREEVVTFCRMERQAANEELPLPAYESEHASGMDIRAAVESSFTLKPGERALVGTGLAVAIPPGFEIQVRPRSGLAINHGVTVLNSPGTIDSDYRGEIKIALINLGAEEYHISRGDRIAQLVVAPVVRATVESAVKLAPTTRGDGGFGHTGV